MKVRGAGHMHTTFSSDGRVELSELVRTAKARGLSFLLLTEHAEAITGEDYQKVVGACDAESSGDFLVVPGLEFMYEGYVHLMGLGLHEHPGLHPLKQQIRSIHGLGGLAVLAHANTCEHVPYDDLEDLDGVEAWNTRYQGSILPDSKGLAILSELRGRVGRPIPCFSGLDFHVNKEFRRLAIEVEVGELSWEALLTALKKGDFININQWFRLGALEGPGIVKWLLVESVSLGLGTTRKLKKSSNQG